MADETHDVRSDDTKGLEENLDENLEEGKRIRQDLKESLASDHEEAARGHEEKAEELRKEE